MLQRFGDTGSAGGGVDHTRIIRQELEAAERELEMVKSELSEKERLVERERTNNDQVRYRLSVRVEFINYYLIFNMFEGQISDLSKTLHVSREGLYTGIPSFQSINCVEVEIFTSKSVKS